MKILISILLFALASAAISGRAVQLNGGRALQAPCSKSPQAISDRALQLDDEQDVLLSANAPGAAGEYIQVYTLPDPVTGRKKLIERILIDADERFMFRMPCDSLCWIILRLGVYEFQLLVESGENYQLELPGYKALTGAEKLDPFFKHKSVHLRLGRDDNPNNAIRSLDSLYYEYAGLVTASIYLGEKLPDSDSLLRAFSDIKGSLEGEYAKRYFSYRYSLLSMISERDISPDPDDLDLINSAYSPCMPAYTDLVQQVFNGWLNRLANNKPGSEISKIINSGKAYHPIVKFIIDQGTISDTSLLELVLLDNLYSEYYKGSFRKEAVEDLLEDISSKAVNQYNRELAAQALRQIQKLKAGNRPPPFSLADRDGKIYTLDSLRGKYSILAFGSADLPETGFELDILSNWVNDYKDKLAVVVILIDEDFELSLRKGGYGKYDFIFLDGSGSDELLSDYEIRYMPSFYFLDRETKLVFSPSVMPSENLRKLIIPRF